MTTTRLTPAISRLRLGLARADVTPPVGIYHRIWGAARHDRATGIHRPLLADVLIVAPLDGHESPWVRVQLDLVGVIQQQHDDLVAQVADAAGVQPERVHITYSHSHSAGWLVPDRFEMLGGDLIVPYLRQLGETLQAATRQARAGLREVVITHAQGQSRMAASRDYWDQDRQTFVCGYNPDAAADTTLVLARITSETGDLLATVVNYACHPTTLAWENSLLSPDFVGAMRETVERETGAPCLYFQGASGDLGPRHGFVGDTAVADRNGRELAYAALATLTAMAPPGTAFAYAGPVISGATLGVWRHEPVDAATFQRAARFHAGSFRVDAPLRQSLDRAALQEELALREEKQRQADAAGDVIAARDHGAHAERARRWLARLADMPPGDTYPLRYSVHLLGDAAWITCGGEPYSLLQTELRRRFPTLALLVSPLDGDLQVAYLLPRDRYGLGLYQEEPSSLAPGSLELLIDTIAARLAALLEETGQP